MNSQEYFMQVTLNIHFMPRSFIIYALNILEYSSLLILDAILFPAKWKIVSTVITLHSINKNTSDWKIILLPLLIRQQLFT